MKMHEPDFVEICKHCGNPYLNLTASTIEVGGKGKGKYSYRFVGALCDLCFTAKYSISGHRSKLDISHARWWHFGKEFEDAPGRPFTWSEKRWDYVVARLEAKNKAPVPVAEIRAQVDRKLLPLITH